MDVEKWLVQKDEGDFVALIKKSNEYTVQFGLKLSEEDAALLFNRENKYLKKAGESGIWRRNSS